MNQQQKQVEEFMRTAEQHVPPGFRFLDDDSVALRAKLILEEALETLEAMGMPIYNRDSGTVEIDDWRTKLPPDEKAYVETIDGLCDMLYVIYGTFSAMGLDAEPFFNEVHMSNMSKFADGVKKDENGKVIKSASFREPDLTRILRTVRDRGKFCFTE